MLVAGGEFCCVQEVSSAACRRLREEDAKSKVSLDCVENSRPS